MDGENRHTDQASEAESTTPGAIRETFNAARELLREYREDTQGTGLTGHIEAAREVGSDLKSSLQDVWKESLDGLQTALSDAGKQMGERQAYNKAYDNVKDQVGDKTSLTEVFTEPFPAWNSPEAKGAAAALADLSAEGRSVTAYAHGPFHDEETVIDLTATRREDGTLEHTLLIGSGEESGKTITGEGTSDLSAFLSHRAGNGSYYFQADVGPKPERTE